MSDDNQLIKQRRYDEKRQTKPIKLDMYLSDPVEKQIYEEWQKEPHKKQLFMKIYIEHLARKQELKPTNGS